MPNGPSIDSRDYADILRESLARISVHNPLWTNFNDSDPGVTLLQLFAFMTESIIYRANQIPDRNRRKFLQLLGIEPKPATAARGFVTLRNDRGALEVRAFPRGLEVRAGQVRYRTTQGLEVLPVEARLFYKQPLATIAPNPEEREQLEALYTQLYQDILADSGGSPAFYETAPMPQPAADGTLPRLDLNATVDGCLWIALLARPGDRLEDVRAQLAGKTLTVGIMPFLEDTGVSLTPAGGTTTATPVHWEIANAATAAARYRPLQVRSNQDILTEPGLVELSLPAASDLVTWDFENDPVLDPEGIGEFPPSLANTDIRDRVITWLRLRIDKPANASSVNADIAWLDINATEIQQRVLVTGEVVGSGNGEPDQVFQLASTPVLPETVSVTVRNTPWQPIDDLLAADPEVPVADVRRPIYAEDAALATADGRRTQVYTINAAGELRMGDGFHGARVPSGARVVVSYAFGGGRLGNVGVGLINRSTQIPAGYSVTNPIRTWGGDNAETLEQAEKSIPATWKNRDRLVSTTDFVEVTRRSPGVDIGRVEALPQFSPGAPNVVTPGAVTVMVIPASLGNDAPRPDQFFLEAVGQHLCPRRLVTTELYIRGPVYVDVWVSVSIAVLGGYAIGPVRQAVEAALFLSLSPLYGGSGSGWPLEKQVLVAELEAIVARVEGVRFVRGLLLGKSGDVSVEQVDTGIELNNLELPQLRGVAVTDGALTPLDQLRQAPNIAGGAGAEGSRLTPIPVVPEQC